MKLTVVLLILAAGIPCFADDAAVDYTRDVKPILHERCYSCHGALKQEGGLRLDTAELARKGGDNGAAVIAKDLVGSPMISRIAATAGARSGGRRLPGQPGDGAPRP